ncbi:NAD(P)-binding protein [Cadophora sp. DSE1049]|nr:NAD(P)-binding protein [Cadophora sp. DSE1049]
MSSTTGFVQRNWKIHYPPKVAKLESAVRIGLLGTAYIAQSAVINPAATHPEATIYAVAARDSKKATAYAEKHGIPKVHGSYDLLLADSDVDAVYIALPVALHFEWAIKSLKAGKHVLLEKPYTANAIDAARLVAFRESLPEPRPLLLEALHYIFHPAWTAFLSMINPATLSHVSSSFKIPGGMKEDDIRFQYHLGGGCLLDLGIYGISNIRQVYGAEPTTCVSTTPRLSRPGGDCDVGFLAEWKFPNGGTGSVDCDLAVPSVYGLPNIKVPKVMAIHAPAEIGDRKAGQIHHRTRTVTFWLYITPTVWNRFDIVDTHEICDTNGKVLKTWKEESFKKVYTWADVDERREAIGDDHWSTYRHQLDQFIHRIKGRAGSGIWVTDKESVAQMKVIDDAYLNAGMKLRPSSTYEP